jgi:8-oxo-dGTP pyrophosphatase MutT (NUDIX family)
MKVNEVRARLTPFPTRLPGIPAAVIPSAIDEAGNQFPRPARTDAERRPAAVLILIFPREDDEAHLVLIARAAGEHRHAGQIGLPGGAIDPTDESVEAAALREAREEVNLNVEQAGVRIVGVLPVFDVRVSGFLVHPVVAFAEREPLLEPDGYEVVEILTPPLATFLPGAPVETVEEMRDGFRLRYGGFRVGEHHVWGATAMMLGRFGAYLGAAPGAPGT